MSDSEGAHTFRVQVHCEEPYYITADYLAVSQVGIIQFGVEESMQPVGVVVPVPGTTIYRVDTLINQEGMKAT